MTGVRHGTSRNLASPRYSAAYRWVADPRSKRVEIDKTPGSGTLLCRRSKTPIFSEMQTAVILERQTFSGGGGGACAGEIALVVLGDIKGGVGNGRDDREDPGVIGEVVNG